MDAGLFEDGAGGATGDDAGTGGGRLQQHPAGTDLTDDRVGDRSSRPAATANRFLLGFLGALLDGQRNLLGLAVAEADPTVAVTDDDEGGEREPPAALDDLGDAVDVDDPRLAQLVASLRLSLVAAIRTPVRLRGRRRRARRRGRGRGSRRGRRRRGDAGGLGPLGDERADLAAAATLPVAVAAGAARWSTLRPACGRRVVDDLARDVLVRPEHGQTRARSAVPCTFLRTRRWRRIAASRGVPSLMSLITTSPPSRPCA